MWAEPDTESQMVMNRERILQLLELLKSSRASEIAVREGDSYIRLRRGGVGAPAAGGSVEAPVAESAAPLPGESAASALPLALPPTPGVEVRARLVGFFHRGPVPGEEPLVEVGSRVKEGQTLATIESLRQMTALTSPASGVVEQIVAEESQAVQFGEVLMVIRAEEE